MSALEPERNGPNRGATEEFDLDLDLDARRTGTTDTRVRPASPDGPPTGTLPELRMPPRAESLQDLPRIQFDPDKWTGLPCIQGCGIPVAAILRSLASGGTIHETLTTYPSLTADDIRQALEYAARQVEIPVISAEQLELVASLKAQTRKR
jgi:uncharacterized protein (DUF433 family)